MNKLVVAINQFAQKNPRFFAGIWFAMAGYLALWLVLLVMGAAINTADGMNVPLFASALPTAIAFGTGSLIASVIVIDSTITPIKAIYRGIFSALAALFLYISAAIINDMTVNFTTLDRVLELCKSPTRILELLFLNIILMINPFVTPSVVVLGGLAGWSLKRFLNYGK